MQAFFFRSSSYRIFLLSVLGCCLFSSLNATLSRAQSPNCPNHWINPATGKVECLKHTSGSTGIESIPQNHVNASVQLNVPLVRQSKGALCGPASIEMVFRYWGEKQLDQYTIAQQIARTFSEQKRFINSSFLTYPDPKNYPGTPAYIMKRYLNRWASSPKYSLKKLPSNPARLNQEFSQAFGWIKKYLDQGIPVITHQYWESKNSTGHYRVITGYDDNKQVIYLNDPKKGKITQSYEEFKRKGAFKGRWLPYYSIAFNTNKKQAPF